MNESPVVAAFKTTYVLQESLKSAFSTFSESTAAHRGEFTRE